MRTLTLYPLKRNLQKGVVFGLGAVALAIYLYTLDGAPEFQVFAVIAFLGGCWMAGKAALQLANPRPVFDADSQGFSVKGKAKRPWSEFRGVVVHRQQTGAVSVTKYVRVKVGKSMLGGHVQLGMTEQSAPAEDMVAQIGHFADAMMSGVVAQEKYHVPPVDATDMPAQPRRAAPVQQTPIAPRPVTARAQQAANSGPVQSVPSFGERLFGRRKVL